MQSTSRVLFSKLRIFLAAQRWSLVLVQHLRGRFGLVCSFPLFLLVSMVGCHQDDLLKRAKALQKKPRAGQWAGCAAYPDVVFLVCLIDVPTVPDFTPVHTTCQAGVHSARSAACAQCDSPAV